jgi:hypothetical protein
LNISSAKELPDMSANTMTQVKATAQCTDEALITGNATLAGEVAPAGRPFRASYPGVAEAVGQARAHVAAVLAGVPYADGAVFALGEVAANAVVHSRSGHPGGSFTIATDVLPGELVIVAVSDQGGPWAERDADTYPHGLEIVKAMGALVRVNGGDDGRTVCVILPWASPPS